MHVFLSAMAVLWLFPVAYALLSSFRDYHYTQEHGYLSFGGFTLHNYSEAWERAEFTGKFLNTAYVVCPLCC